MCLCGLFGRLLGDNSRLTLDARLAGARIKADLVLIALTAASLIATERSAHAQPLAQDNAGNYLFYWRDIQDHVALR